MILGKVTGTVVSGQRGDEIQKPRFLLVSPCDAAGKVDGNPLVVLDLTGARRDEVVLVCQGSSCTWTAETTGKPVDALTVGIVDQVDLQGLVTYRK